MRDDKELAAGRAPVEAAALAFHDIVNAMPDFVIYKTLVGYDSVFSPAWHDKESCYKKPTEYRAEQVEALLSSVDEANADAWFDRISRNARTESDDFATFPGFGNFLEGLAVAKPAIALNDIERIEGPLAHFLSRMLAGLMRSTERAIAFARIDGMAACRCAYRPDAWYLRFAEPFDEALLRRTLGSAVQPRRQPYSH